MNISKIGMILCLSVPAMVLTGCLDDKPSDKLTSETIRPYANQDLAEGLEIANFQRSNGQVDPDSANKYQVTYTYDLRLTKPYAEVVLMGAKSLQQSNTEAAQREKESGAVLSPNAIENSLNNLTTSLGIGKWMDSQGDKWVPRRDAFLNSCSACLVYWNSKDHPEETMARRASFVTAWLYFDNLGFKDNFKAGDSVPREVAAAFTKTEKGWQPVK